jgi:hypothetical protein
MTGAGYSGKPLIEKLGVRPGDRVVPVHAPDGYRALLGELPDGARIVDGEEAGQEPEFVHVFATEPAPLRAALARWRARIAQDGMIWVSWPKKSSGTASELDGNAVRGLGLEAGLVDVKVCAVDETWSGLKFVIRVADRR